MTWLADHWLHVLGLSGSAFLIYSLFLASVLHVRAKLGYTPSSTHGALKAQTEKEAIGALLLRNDCGTAPVLPVYVTPQDADLVSGETVSKLIGVRIDSGIRRVATPHGTIAACYDRLGFRRERASWIPEVSK